MYLSLLNLPKEFRRAPQNKILLALLPVVKFPGNNLAKNRLRSMYIYQKTQDLVLAKILEDSQSGKTYTGCNQNYSIFPIVMSYPGDTAEHEKITATRKHSPNNASVDVIFCHACDITVENVVLQPLQFKIRSIEEDTLLREKYLNEIKDKKTSRQAIDKKFKKYSIHPIKVIFFQFMKSNIKLTAAKWIEFNLFKGVHLPCRLHVLDEGIGGKIHLFSWFIKVVGVIFGKKKLAVLRSLNLLFDHIPPFPNYANCTCGVFSTTPKDGIIQINLKDGNQFRSAFKIFRFLVWAVVWDNPKFLWFLDLVNSFCKVYEKSHYKSFSDLVLTEWKNEISEFTEICKEFVTDYSPSRLHFKKFHLLQVNYNWKSI